MFWRRMALQDNRKTAPNSPTNDYRMDRAQGMRFVMRLVEQAFREDKPTNPNTELFVDGEGPGRRMMLQLSWEDYELSG